MKYGEEGSVGVVAVLYPGQNRAFYYKWRFKQDRHLERSAGAHRFLVQLQLVKSQYDSS